MAFTLSMLFKSDSAQAKADLRALQGEVAKTGTGAKALDTAAKAGAAGVTTLGTSADRAAADVKELAAAQTAAAQTSRTLTQANGMAAGSVGNLVAQFNDVGMMMAAGQNPLMLAVQQGSQISQVIGPMGAAGAVKALGAAFVGMLSPVNLAVYGSIAGLALVTQWLVSTGATADAVAGQFDKVRDAVAATQDEIDKLRFGVDEEYQVELLREQLQLRDQYSLKVAELQGYLGQTTDSLDRQRISTAGLRSEIEEIAARYNEISAVLNEQQNRSTQLAILEGIKAQAAGEAAAALRDGLAEQDALAAATEALRDMLVSAASVNLSGVFDSALGSADTLLGKVGAILAGVRAAAGEYAAAQGQLGQMAVEFSPGGQSLIAYGGRGAPNAAQTALANRNTPRATGGTGVGTGSGRGGGGAAAERDAVAELIERLREEQQLILETDPVREELAKHRKTLAGATAAERAEIEKLIIEEQRLNAVRDVMDEIGQIGKDAFTGLVTGAHSLRDALSMVIGKLADMAASSAWDAIWGGGGGFGGLLAGLFGGGRRGGTGTLGLPFFADGGMIYGDGGGTADKVPVMMSPGEFAVNARSTARYRPVLERINAGMDLPGFAAGGIIGGGAPLAMGGGQGRAVPLEVHVHGAAGDKDIEERVQAGVAAGLTLYRREGFAHDFKMVQKQGGRVTG